MASFLLRVIVYVKQIAFVHFVEIEFPAYSTKEFIWAD